MHPKKFEPTPTTECSLCGGHFQDGTPYLHLQMETWNGPDANLCGKCIGLMHGEVVNMRKEKRSKPNG